MTDGTKPEAGHKRSYFHVLLLLMAILLAVFGWQMITSSKSKPASTLAGSTVQDFYDEIQAKWNKGFMELPAEDLIIITPHNERIREKFEQYFAKHCALKEGKRILIWWQEASGSNAILDDLLGARQQGRSPRIDVVFGGGVYLFSKLAEAGMLAPLSLSEEIRRAIPAEYAGLKLIDPDGLWCGNVLSGFGFLYNQPLLQQTGLESLATWQDLGRPEMFDQISIADPSVSGSAVMAFEMILQSAEDWPSGWAELLAILSNAREFTSDSDKAANGPLFGQTAAAICIDFNGTSRVALHPDTLVYVNPHQQTAFTPDPIAVLQDAPHPDTARAFVEFVLSPEGQKVWGLEMETPQIPALNSPYRNPIRMDFYTQYARQLPAGMVNPYQQGQALRLDPDLRNARYGILMELVKAAAVENFEGMKAARAKLIETDFDPARLKKFNQLPENLDTLDEMYTVSRSFEDPAQKERMVAAWTLFFEDLYCRVSQ